MTSPLDPITRITTTTSDSTTIGYVTPNANIGYVTPNDEHNRRGEAIRQARQHGLQQARQNRLGHNRRTTLNNPGKTQ